MKAKRQPGVEYADASRQREYAIEFSRHDRLEELRHLVRRLESAGRHDEAALLREQLLPSVSATNKKEGA